LAPASTGTATPTATLTETPVPTPAAYGPFDFPENVNPLTGLVVEDTQLLNRRPVAVKVSNFPRELRPHSGLSFADIVYEYYIGTGATRFTAIFYGDNAEKAGPVRSARLIDASLVSIYQGVLGFVSAFANYGVRFETDGASEKYAIIGMRPFDQANTSGKRVFHTQFQSIVRLLQTVHVEMIDRPPLSVIHLNQCKRGTRDLFRMTGQRVDEGAGKDCFPGTEIAKKCNDIAWRSQCCQQGRQSCGSGFALHDDVVSLCRGRFPGGVVSVHGPFYRQRQYPATFWVALKLHI